MTMSLALAVHMLAAVVWVGGMFFAYMALRPAAASLAPAERLPLWRRSFGLFFPWVWAAILALLLSGYWIVFAEWGGFAGAGMHVHVMQGLGLLMMLLFLHLWFAPYKRLQQALDSARMEEAGKQLGRIRFIVGTNLILGLVVVAVAALGRGWR